MALIFLEPKSIFGEMVIVLFYPGHSVPHLEFQNGGGFGPHLREGRMAPTRVGPLWVYPAGIKPKCERAPLFDLDLDSFIKRAKRASSEWRSGR